MKTYFSKKGNLIFCFQNDTMRHLLNITLMMEAACTSEMSVNIQLRTRQYIPKDSELHVQSRFLETIMEASNLI
jgi:hypothetical protein